MSMVLDNRLDLSQQSSQSALLPALDRGVHAAADIDLYADLLGHRTPSERPADRNRHLLLDPGARSCFPKRRSVAALERCSMIPVAGSILGRTLRETVLDNIRRRITLILLRSESVKLQSREWSPVRSARQYLYTISRGSPSPLSLADFIL